MSDYVWTSESGFAPTLTHALGNRSGGRVRLRTATLEPYGHVTCEHPVEFIAAVRSFGHADQWIECDDGSILQLRHVVKVEVEPDA